ncbi:MAG: ABC transporter substrate-binding protein [Actinomycetota bacterium]|nr:ABC transporter substrate-binding protein [Actinomycetota bacterium]
MGIRHLSLVVLCALGLLAACATGAPTSAEPAREVLRLGYFPNVTHAPAIYGVEENLFAAALGSDVDLQLHTFNSGSEAIQALFSEALDATYIGPNPAINAHAQSGGEAIRIVAGATSGGAKLVVREGILSPADLAGSRLASPSLGNTQDVALRAWLSEQGLAANLQGGGDVSVTPQDNAQTLESFRARQIDGAWMPEPWATRLEREGGGHVLVDERSLWPDGKFATTHLVVATSFLEQHEEVVRRLLEGHIAAVDAVNADPRRAQEVVNSGIEAAAGKGLAPETIAGAWESITFTIDPIAASLRKSAEDATKVGLLDPVDLEGIYRVDLLNELLRQRGREEVSD